jgi:Mn2+/Fe2+ NRAMP family transporter
LPIILFAVLRLVNNREIMGAHVNGPIYNLSAWLTTILVTALSLFYMAIMIFPKLLRV